MLGENRIKKDDERLQTRVYKAILPHGVLILNHKWNSVNFLGV